MGVEMDTSASASAPAPVGVLIVDVQAPFRGAARAVVGATKEFSVIGEAESGEEAVELVDRLHPDLVLMDINMGGIDGIEATRQICAANPETKVVLVTTYAAGDLAADARTCGAVAYVHKEELAPKVLRELWSSGGDADWQLPTEGGEI
jgi:DNA-binding NarL/FixJ family response regulator